MQLSRNLELAAAAVAASVATATLIFSYQSRQNRQRIKDIKRNAGTLGRERAISLNEFSVAKRSLPEGIQNEAEECEHEQLLMSEQLSRNRSFLGDPGMEKLQNAFVIIVGAGGVGSWAALMLARSGVKRMRIIDFDQVTLSSLNRHAVANRADVGTAKVIAIRDHLRRIVPLIEIDACVELFSKDSAAHLLQDNPDMVLDCIDNIDTKVDLLEYCHKNNITVMSSMGAGAKADPSRIQLADISDTNEDHLARAVRRRLKQRNILSGIDVVYSTEKPGEVNLLPLAESQVQESDEFAILPDFRVRILPVLGLLPAMFGMAMATYTICKLADHKIEPLPVKLRGRLYDRMQRELIVREDKVFGNKTGIPFDRDDIAYIVEEVWRGKSVLTGMSDKLCLTRWDRRLPMSFQNCVCLTKSEATRHEACDPDNLHELYSAETLALVEKRFTEERYYSQWR
ncbi:hypothetical protein BDF22DRAFT_700487 [Syncephalis plumigaleata]|nr:hypothetical protein BDF22DRAFT_700487 [Syncephalis plumigaleata]